jgi:hypothetical protein
MGFGLTGAPATFQNVMNKTLAPVLRHYALVFFDDILVYRATYADHLIHLEHVLSLLSDQQWRVKMSKCDFAQQQVHYLGHVISSKGVATDESKIKDVLEWPSPQNLKELHGFLGLSGYYRKFVRAYGVLSKPLSNLLRKHVPFVWTSETEAAFQALKAALVSAPVLALPDYSKLFVVETDASDTGVGAVLLQDDHPIAFVSKPLGPRTRGLSTYEKEYMVILLAVEKWRSYLQHAEFLIRTDHSSLASLSENRLHTPWQQKVFTKLLGLQFRIQYRRGSENRVADALSRRPHPAEHALALSSIQPLWMQEISDSYQADTRARELLQKLSINPAVVPGFTLRDGILRINNRIWLPANSELHTKIVLELHASAAGGHSGIPVTLRRVKQLFHWQGLKSTVKKLVSECITCQQAKPDRAKYPGLLQPLPVPAAAWQIISMDFIEGLPCSGRCNCILVVVDKFSRYAHFIGLSHPFTAASVAAAFMDNVHKLHGMPESIVSDRDRVFTSAFWKELFRRSGTFLRMSSSYHPQTDGQTERVNQCLEAYLRCFCHACPTK